MLDQRTAELTMALRNAARCRACELNEEQLEGYLLALGRCDPVAVLNACAMLWRDVDSRTMPTPAAIIARVNQTTAEQRARQAALPEPETPHGDHAFGLECAGILNRMLAKQVSLQAAEAEMDDAARRLLDPGSRARYMWAAQETRTATNAVTWLPT